MIIKQSLFLSVLICSAILMSALKGGEKSKSNDMLAAHESMKYKRARELAALQPENAAGKLVIALSKLHDEKFRDIAEGLEELKMLYDNPDVPATIWRESALNYARMSQLYQRRKELFDEADGIDFNAVYRKLINKYPDSSEACWAIVYFTEAGFNSGNSEEVANAFKNLEEFCDNYKGDSPLLTPVHLFADFQYIVHKKDFKSAVEHLLAALRLGIENQRLREEILYRIGRIYQTKLKNPRNAQMYYKQFLREYPNSRCVPVIERYLKKISEGRR
jgi:tetratricopeptide repeat protein